MLDSNLQLQIQSLARLVGDGCLSQQTLAAATGVDQSQISRILAGHARRASKNVLKLCKYAESVDDTTGLASTADQDISTLVAAMLGKSRAEDAALAALIASLSRWRLSWESQHE